MQNLWLKHSIGQQFEEQSYRKLVYWITRMKSQTLLVKKALVLVMIIAFITSCEPDFALTDSETSVLLLSAGFQQNELNTMICIAHHESAMRPDAIGVATPLGKGKDSIDIGLFQINNYFWARPISEGGCGVTEYQLLDPAINAQCARRVFNRHGYDGWVAYRKHMLRCNDYVADLRLE